MESTLTYVGTVIWFNNEVNYGFIAWENHPDLFVHFSDINCQGFKTLKKDSKVSFGLGTNHRGQPKATEVTVLL